MAYSRTSNAIKVTGMNEERHIHCVQKKNPGLSWAMHDETPKKGMFAYVKCTKLTKMVKTTGKPTKGCRRTYIKRDKR